MKRRPFDLVRLSDLYNNDQDKDDGVIAEDGREEYQH